MHRFLRCKFVLYTTAIISWQYVVAQKTIKAADCNYYYTTIRYIVNAPETLPRLHKEGKLDEMQNFADNWMLSPSPSVELVFALKTLMAAENNNVQVRQLPGNFMLLLDDYAKELRKAGNDGTGFKYYIKLNEGGYLYDASNDVVKVLRFTSTWAANLLHAKQTDSTTAFLCRVFAGSIARPSAYFAENRNSYPAVNSYVNSLEAVRENCFVAKRNGSSPTLHLLAGIWVPSGNLAMLGAHPSIGLQFGARNKMNEYDITWWYRFAGTSTQPFNVLRQDTLYNSTHYDGGYIGFDYTRYIIHRLSFEAGIIAGMGYDYFDAFPASYRNIPGGPDLEPYNIGSFNFNAGLLVKWFIHRGATIGIQARYHWVNYNNNGGTDLSGNAVTLDLSYGFN